MKKIKCALLVAFIALISTTFCFAKPANNAAPVAGGRSERDSSDMKMLPPEDGFPIPTETNITSIEAKVKVSTKKDITLVYLETANGTYVVDVNTNTQEGQDILTVLKGNKGKKLIVSGFPRNETGIFHVLFIGSVTAKDDSGIWK